MGVSIAMESKKEVSEFLNQKFEDLRQEYSELRQFKDPALFTYICVKYFFLGEDDYDVDEVLKCICDTSNDCSIDAICNDHTDEDQPLVFIQTKHTSFDFTTAKGEIEEIGESVKNSALSITMLSTTKLLIAIIVLTMMPKPKTTPSTISAVMFPPKTKHERRQKSLNKTTFV